MENERLLTDDEFDGLDGAALIEAQDAKSFESGRQSAAKEIIQTIENFYKMPHTMFLEKYPIKFNEQRGWALTMLDYIKSKYNVEV